MSKKMVKASIKIANTWAHARGKDVESAINNLRPQMKVRKGMAVLTLERDRKKERVLSPVAVSNIFGDSSPNMRNLAIQRMAATFDI